MALFGLLLPSDEEPVFQLDPKLVQVLYEERFDVELGQGVHLNMKSLVGSFVFRVFGNVNMILLS